LQETPRLWYPCNAYNRFPHADHAVSVADRRAVIVSKGLGHIEREVLRLLPPQGQVDSVALTLMVYGIAIPEDLSGLHHLHDLVTNAQRVAVRRALASLKRKGLVEEVVQAKQTVQRQFLVGGCELQRGFRRP
jgi:hypothetical protein